MNKKAALLVGLGGVVVYGLIRALQAKYARNSNWHTAQKQVDLSSEDSFPASDPPSWTPVAATQ